MIAMAPGWNIVSGVGFTALGAAAMRAVKGHRAEPLVGDPYAAAFVKAAAGLRQAVILGAGLDTRAPASGWPSCTASSEHTTGPSTSHPAPPAVSSSRFDFPARRRQRRGGSLAQSCEARHAGRVAAIGTLGAFIAAFIQIGTVARPLQVSAVPRSRHRADPTTAFAGHPERVLVIR
jgi:hypothetical protein